MVQAVCGNKRKWRCHVPSHLARLNQTSSTNSREAGQDLQKVTRRSTKPRWPRRRWKRASTGSRGQRGGGKRRLNTLGPPFLAHTGGCAVWWGWMSWCGAPCVRNHEKRDYNVHVQCACTQKGNYLWTCTNKMEKNGVSSIKKREKEGCNKKSSKWREKGKRLIKG